MKVAANIHKIVGDIKTEAKNTCPKRQNLKKLYNQLLKQNLEISDLI